MWRCIIHHKVNGSWDDSPFHEKVIHINADDSSYIKRCIIHQQVNHTWKVDSPFVERFTFSGIRNSPKRRGVWFMFSSDDSLFIDYSTLNLWFTFSCMIHICKNDSPFGRIIQPFQVWITSSWRGESFSKRCIIQEYHVWSHLFI